MQSDFLDIFKEFSELFLDTVVEFSIEIIPHIVPLSKTY